MKDGFYRLTTALALLALCASTAAAQICVDTIAASAPDSRFSANGDGTVTDLSTGLIWKQCVEGLSGAGCTSGSAAQFTWSEALGHAAGAGFAGYTDWRLPNTNELESLVEVRCADPAINASYFPNTPPSGHWSSSPYSDYSGSAWVVYFGHGHVYVSEYLPGDPLTVRLVRGGP